MLDNAGRMLKQGDMSWYEGLHGRIEGLPKDTRNLLRQYLASLTLAAPHPAEQFARCSGPVFNAICAQAGSRLGAAPPDHALAARLYQAVCELYEVQEHTLEHISWRIPLSGRPFCAGRAGIRGTSRTCSGNRAATAC